MNRSVVIAVSLGIAGLIGSAPAYAEPITEDSPAWSCVANGNRICGPTNTEGMPAGCYDDRGRLVAVWPCHLVVNTDGSADIYTGAVK